MKAGMFSSNRKEYPGRDRIELEGSRSTQTRASNRRCKSITLEHGRTLKPEYATLRSRPDNGSGKKENRQNCLI
jgi:hypothetical protein